MKTRISPAFLISMQGEPKAEPGQSVVIEGRKIIEVGPTQAMQTRHPDAQALDLPDAVLMPGLINTHAHAAMNLLRGVGDDLPLMDWLQKRIWPLEGALVDEAFVYDGTSLACAEMLRGGVTTFNDMYFYPGQAVAAAHDMGMRIVAGITTIEFPTRYASNADDYLDKGLAARDQWKGEPGVHFALAPHAPYTIEDGTFSKIAMLAEQLDLPVHVHLQETAFEVEDALARTGKRPVERLNALGLVNERLLAVHGVHLNETDLALLGKAGASLAHCPASNLKLASGIAPITQALAAGVNLTIGTDGAASNNRLDLWEETRLAALLAKGSSGDAASLPAQACLKALTVNAARALGLENSIGQIKAGFEADMVAVALPSTPGLLPIFDTIAHLVYTNQRQQVSEVWVGGQHVVHMQQLAPKVNTLESESIRKVRAIWQTRVQEALQESPQ